MCRFETSWENERNNAAAFKMHCPFKEMEKTISGFIARKLVVKKMALPF